MQFQEFELHVSILSFSRKELFTFLQVTGFIVNSNPFVEISSNPIGSLQLSTTTFKSFYEYLQKLAIQKQILKA